MANAKNRRSVGNQGKNIILLLIVCCALIFAIGLISRRQTEEFAESTIPTTESTQATAASQISVSTEMQTAGTSAAETMPITVETIASETEATDPETAEYGHVYIRVNREKQIPLPDGFEGDVVWSISNDNVAIVEQDGTLTGLEQGKCTVTASCNGENVEIPVTVREMTIDSGCTYVDGILVANKSYSLPKDYDPGLLSVTEEAFEALSADAAAQGLDIHNSSDYRSYDFQVEVYNSMVEGYSKEYADSVSARPGHSEHQTGYTIDCNTIDNTFAETDEGKWLADHCWEYGFIIRYPEDKVDITGYAYESWHIRYVGVEHAKEIHEQRICLEEYLDIDSKYAE